MQCEDGSDFMLDKKAVELINKLLEKGFDIEIQHRKDGIVITTEEKQFICKIK